MINKDGGKFLDFVGGHRAHGGPHSLPTRKNPVPWRKIYYCHSFPSYFEASQYLIVSILAVNIRHYVVLH